MTIQGIQGQLQQVPQVQQPTPAQGAAPAKAGGAESFGQMLENALQEVTDLQTQAEQQIEAMATNKDGATPHGVMVALEKADVAFQLMSAIRGKIIRAYEEVIRTQV